MKRLLTPFVLTVLAWLGTLPAPAQDKAPAPIVAPPSSGAPNDSTPCKKVACPTMENVKHTCVRYDVKEEDYCATKCAHISIFTRLCQCCCGKGAPGANEAEPCHKCGQPRTRKVLIKEFVTEEVPTPKCRVDRVGESCPAVHPALVPAIPAGTKPPAAPVEQIPAPKEPAHSDQ